MIIQEPNLQGTVWSGSVALLQPFTIYRDTAAIPSLATPQLDASSTSIGGFSDGVYFTQAISAGDAPGFLCTR